MDERDLPWAVRADIAQRSLDHYFGAGWPRFLANRYPADRRRRAAKAFHYWWLAHVIDVRIDAFERSGDGDWLAAARLTYESLRVRNRGALVNDYFDDMLWLGLALLRLAGAAGEPRYRRDAEALWDHIVTHGWNDAYGPSLAWRTRQLDYKNTPANGPFAILSARLGGDHRLEYAQAAFDWLTSTMVGEDGLVADGVNRQGDGGIDRAWRFTYNQGVYVGAAVELYRHTGDPALVRQATRTALTAVEQLSDGTVFHSDGEGDDAGLFQGICYRYLGLLRDILDDGDRDGDGDPARTTLDAFVRRSTDTLWRSCFRDGWLLAGHDWSAPPQPPVPYSAQLSAIMAIEQRCRLDD